MTLEQLLTDLATAGMASASRRRRRDHHLRRGGTSAGLPSRPGARRPRREGPAARRRTSQQARPGAPATRDPSPRPPLPRRGVHHPRRMVRGPPPGALGSGRTHRRGRRGLLLLPPPSPGPRPGLRPPLDSAGRREVPPTTVRGHTGNVHDGSRSRPDVARIRLPIRAVMVAAIRSCPLRGIHRRAGFSVFQPAQVLGRPHPLPPRFSSGQLGDRSDLPPLAGGDRLARWEKASGTKQGAVSDAMTPPVSPSRRLQTSTSWNGRT